MKADMLKGAIPQLDGIQVIENHFLPSRTMMVSSDVAETLRQLPAKEEVETPARKKGECGQ